MTTTSPSVLTVQPNTGDETPLSWVGHWMFTLYDENLGDDLILLPLPDFGTGSKGAMGSWNWAASSGPDGIPASGDEVDLDAVWAFIDYATSPESVLRFVNGYGAVPPTPDLTDFPGFQPGERAGHVHRLPGQRAVRPEPDAERLRRSARDRGVPVHP